MPDSDSSPRSQRGFTLIEAVITVALLGILLLIGLPTVLGTLNRTRLTGTTREIATLLQVARLEAIKMDAPVEVNYDVGSNSFISFVDMDRDGLESAPDRRLGSVIRVPRKIEFRGPGDAAPNGANAIDGWDNAPANPGPVFRPDGSADRVGAYRFRDSNNNILEVRIETPATGRMILRKWDPALDIFYAHLENDRRWEWY